MNCLLKSSQKEKPEQKRPMLLSYMASVTYKKLFNFTLDNRVRYEAAFVGHNSENV